MLRAQFKPYPKQIYFKSKNDKKEDFEYSLSLEMFTIGALTIL